MSPYKVKTRTVHFLFPIVYFLILMVIGERGQVSGENGCLKINGDTKTEFKFIAHDTACFFSEIIKTEPILKKVAFESLLLTIQGTNGEVSEAETKFVTGADSKFVVKYASTPGSKNTEQVRRYFTVILYKTRQGPRAFVKEGTAGLCPASSATATKQKGRQPALTSTPTVECVDLQGAKEKLRAHFEVTKQATVPIPSPKKGDHVINNKVDKIYADSVDRFLEKTYGRQENLPQLLAKANSPRTADKVHQDYTMPIPTKYWMDIQKTTVDFKQGDRKLPDVNSVMYGRFVDALTAKTAECLKELTQNPTGSGHVHCRRTVELIVGIMNDGGVYIDEEARDKYIKDSRDRDVAKTVESRREAVVYMLSKLSDETTLRAWAKEIGQLIKNQKSK